MISQISTLGSRGLTRLRRVLLCLGVRLHLFIKVLTSLYRVTNRCERRETNNDNHSDPIQDNSVLRSWTNFLNFQSKNQRETLTPTRSVTMWFSTTHNLQRTTLTVRDNNCKGVSILQEYEFGWHDGFNHFNR